MTISLLVFKTLIANNHASMISMTLFLFNFAFVSLSLPYWLMQVMYKTLNPHWNQTLEFPDDGSPLLLHVKDHNNLLPTSSIGDCVVEYQRLPPNEMSDKWIPLQGVKRGEIHIQITRKVPDLLKKHSLDSEPSLTRAHQISSQVIEAKYVSHFYLLFFLLLPN